jgi:hypothetical protein
MKPSTNPLKLFLSYLMKNSKQLCPTALPLVCVFLTLALSSFAASGATTTGKIFATPEQALSELSVAVNNMDTNALRIIFGPAVEDLHNPDRVQATNDLRKFGAAINETNHWSALSDKSLVLEVGKDSWPFPVPLVKTQSGWYFDTETGKDEILNRRIGKNELATLATVRAYVAAQREYASRDRDGDGVLEYAQKIKSTPGTHDGLYWPADDGEISPLGPLVADAQEQGYRFHKEGEAPQPFQGYYFKILTEQGKHAPGGKYNYIINGNMIGGFGLVAWPADYGDTGIMTFFVNQQGIVYQKDLGEKTEKLAPNIKAYDPDSSWKVSKE